MQRVYDETINSYILCGCGGCVTGRLYIEPINSSQTGVYMMDGKDNQLSVECARYISDYVNEEVMRGKTITKFTIMGALVAYYGGADDMEDDDE